MAVDMDPTQLLTISFSLVWGLFAVLIGVIGWIGARVITKQDEVLNRLDIVKDELHNRIASIDSRLIRVETKLEVRE